MEPVMSGSRRLLAPVIAALVAGGGVAGISLADGSTGRTQSARAGQDAGMDLQNAFVEVVRRISPSVVQIEDRTGLGSGIVFDSKGDIVTNNHVVRGARSFVVTTPNGKRYRAALLGAFPPDDLAVVRVRGAKLNPAVFADSSKLRVGDIAVAIGNPLGLRSTPRRESSARFARPSPRRRAVSSCRR
jgi:putative serine protease PepD